MAGEEKIRTYAPRWRPKGPANRMRAPIDVYFDKHPGLTPEELEKVNPRLLKAIELNDQVHLMAGQAPEEYQRLAVAYEEAFVGPNGIRKRMFRQRRFGKELVTWLLEQYPDGLPFPEQMRRGNPEQRKFYNDLKYAKLLGMLNKFKGLDGHDPVQLYYELCERLGGVITRGKLPLLVSEGGKAIHHALSRMPDPETPGQSMLHRHVPVRVLPKKRSSD